MRMLCCFEEARRCKNCGSHDGQLWHSNCRRIMFCTWPQIRMERLFLKLIKKKLIIPGRFPPPKKLPPLICPVWNRGSPWFSPPLYKRERGRRNYAYVAGSSFWWCKSWISVTEAEALEEEQEQKIKLKRPEISVPLNQENKKTFQERLN